MGGSVEGSGEGDVGFQIAPMVDVVFVIMLFFMASAGAQVVQKELGVMLPASANANPSSAPLAPVVLDIRVDGQVLYNQQPVDTPGDKKLPELRQRLGDLMNRLPANPVIIRPEAQVIQERVIDVLDAAAVAKVKNLSFG